MQARHRKALRDLWAMRAQALAIALVLASGIAMLVMSQATLDSLRETRARLYADFALADVWARLVRAPESLATRLAELPGVAEVDTRLQAAGKLTLPQFDEPVEALVQSLPDEHEPRLNRLHLRAGRLPAPFTTDELLVSDAFADAQRLTPGTRVQATLHGRAQGFTVVGIVTAPEYLYQIKPGALSADYQRYAIVWLPRRALAAALNMQGAFNSVALRLAPGAHEADVIAGVDALLARYGSRGAYGRLDQTAYRYLHEELKQLEKMTRIFPAIFLGVAAFLLNVVFTRLIGTQRAQVAILKAFGYSTAQVAAHYGLMVIAICLVGTAIGLALGLWLGQELAGLYQMNFRFPYLDFHLQAGVVAAGVGVALAAALAGAGRAVWAAAGEPIAQAMRPAAPARFRQSAIERAGLARWLTQPTRIMLRQLALRPLRAALMVAALALAGGIMMLARFQTGTISHMIDMQYRLSQQHDIAVTFIDTMPRRALAELAAIPGVREVEGQRSVAVKLWHEQRVLATRIDALGADDTLRRLIDTRLRRVAVPPDGLVLGEYMARKLGVAVGDEVGVQVLEGRQPLLRLPVVQLVQEYVGVQAYMDSRALARLLGEGEEVTGALLTVAPGQGVAVLRALAERPRVAAAESRLASVQAFFKMMDQVSGPFTWISVMLGAVVNFGVVYNAMRIALAERARELASLRVLGFTQGEVARILFGEMGLLVLVSLPLGGAAGYGLAWLLAVGMQSDLYRVPVFIPPSAYAFAALVTVVSALASALAVARQLRRLDMLEALKSHE